jgi:alcohol dehydrogenase class IV
MSEAVHRLCVDIGLTSRLRDFGVSPSDYDRIVELAQRSDNVLANPRPATIEQLRGLLERAQ